MKLWYLSRCPIWYTYFTDYFSAITSVHHILRERFKYWWWQTVGRDQKWIIIYLLLLISSLVDLHCFIEISRSIAFNHRPFSLVEKTSPFRWIWHRWWWRCLNIHPMKSEMAYCISFLFVALLLWILMNNAKCLTFLFVTTLDLRTPVLIRSIVSCKQILFTKHFYNAILLE